MMVEVVVGGGGGRPLGSGTQIIKKIIAGMKFRQFKITTSFLQATIMT